MKKEDLSCHVVARRSFALGIAAAAMLGLRSVGPTGRACANEPSGIRWLFHGAGAAAIAADPETSRLLDGTRPFVMTGRAVPSIPKSWNAVPFASFTSFEALRDAAKGDSLDSQVRGIMYDYERWHFTPQDEQRNPAEYLKRAADLVHARGLLFITAPAVNIVMVMAPDSPDRQYDTYLRLGVAADAARYADVFDIQAQGSERNTEYYANFVQRAAAQARQANPHVVVLAGLSTQPSGQNVTADNILRAITATRQYVDGYWLNIPEPSDYCPRCTTFRPDIAIEVLRRNGRQ
jgi:hypothetical protein